MNDKYEQWIWDRLVCRTDFISPYDGFIAKPQATGAQQFAAFIHQAANGQGAFALQAKGPNGAKYTMIDPDCHDRNTDCGAVEAWAMQMYEAAKAKNLNPLLEASGRGYHIWLLYSTWCDWRAARQAGLDLIGEGYCEVFPMRGWINAACRVPGVHPNGVLTSRIWNDSAWLEWGDDAIDYICTFTGVDPPAPLPTPAVEVSRVPIAESPPKPIAPPRPAFVAKPCCGQTKTPLPGPKRKPKQ